MGHKNMFGFDLDYQRFDTLRSFLTGTPPVLSLSLIEPGVDMLLEAGMDKVRAKSVQQTEYLIGLWDALLKDLGFSLNTPRDPNKRGSHVSIGHEEGLRIDLALIHDMNVIPDFRAPDNIRLGIAPLYTSFSDILETVTRLKKIVTEDLFKKYSHETPTVT
jgi:kynureninase